MAGKTLKRVILPMVGKHNVQNALAAVAIAQEMEVPPEVIRKALATFSGVKRRFTVTGEANGITVIDDYGHHPIEIAAALAAARASSKNRVIAVVQPHRFSRIKFLFEEFCTCFNDADIVIISDIYPAGEQPIDGISRDRLIDGLIAHGHQNVLALETPERLPSLIDKVANNGDMVICLGAGNITAWANDLPGSLKGISTNVDAKRGPDR